MGGNALASSGATRCSREVALQVLEDFQTRFAQITAHLGNAARVEPIAAYRQKPDFGDLDVLVDSRVFQAMPHLAVINALSASYGSTLPWVKNGSVLSVGLPLAGDGQFLQLDLISTLTAEFDFSLGYFSWNDMGNLVGRGFDSLDDIYQFVASGQRFNPDMYPLEHRNHTARVRDKKRPVYMGFLRWIEAQPALRRFDWKEDKALYLREVMAAFPALREDYDYSLVKLSQAKAIRACFNGEVVTAATGLTGKQLGEFMAHFKREQAGSMNDLPSLSAEQLRELISVAYQQYVRTSAQSTS